MTPRICLLETGNLRPQLIDQYQNYGRMFEQLFESQSIPAQFDVYNAAEEHYPERSHIVDCAMDPCAANFFTAEQSWADADHKSTVTVLRSVHEHRADAFAQARVLASNARPSVSSRGGLWPSRHAAMADGLARRTGACL